MPGPKPPFEEVVFRIFNGTTQKQRLKEERDANRCGEAILWFNFICYDDSIECELIDVLGHHNFGDVFKFSRDEGLILSGYIDEEELAESLNIAPGIIESFIMEGELRFGDSGSQKFHAEMAKMLAIDFGPVKKRRRTVKKKPIRKRTK